MTFFRDSSIPLWKIFGGNLLLFIAILFYIAWWVVTFQPNRTSRTTAAGFFIALAFLPGVVAILILFSGVSSLSQAGKGFPVIYILLGAVVFLQHSSCSYENRFSATRDIGIAIDNHLGRTGRVSNRRSARQ